MPKCERPYHGSGKSEFNRVKPKGDPKNGWTAVRDDSIRKGLFRMAPPPAVREKE